MILNAIIEEFYPTSQTRLRRPDQRTAKATPPRFNCYKPTEIACLLVGVLALLHRALCKACFSGTKICTPFKAKLSLFCEFCRPFLSTLSLQPASLYTCLANKFNNSAASTLQDSGKVAALHETSLRASMTALLLAVRALKANCQSGTKILQSCLPLSNQPFSKLLINV